MKIDCSLELLREKYRKLNDSFPETMVFHSGVSAGIFSEINMMLGCMAYCLLHKIRFSIYSDDANYAFGNGWQTYFEPFCPEVHDRFHHHYNHRLPYLSLKNEILKAVQFFPKIYLRRKYHFRYLTYEIWRKILKKSIDSSELHIPELGMNGTVFEALPILRNIFWNYNPETRKEVDNLILRLGLPLDYVGFQIRLGDKINEVQIPESSKYINMAEEKIPLRDAFVFTDDYEQGFLDLCRAYPDWSLKTLTPESDHGYLQAEKNIETPESRYDRHVFIFASIEILIRSRFFCGLLGANPSRFVWISRNYENCSFLDVKQ